MNGTGPGGAWPRLLSVPLRDCGTLPRSSRLACRGCAIILPAQPLRAVLLRPPGPRRAAGDDSSRLVSFQEERTTQIAMFKKAVSCSASCMSTGPSAGAQALLGGGQPCCAGLVATPLLNLPRLGRMITAC